MFDREELAVNLRRLKMFCAGEDKRCNWRVFGIAKPGEGVGYWKTHRIFSQWLREISREVPVDFNWLVVFEYGRSMDENMDTRIYFVFGGLDFNFYKQFSARWQRISSGNRPSVFKYRADTFPKWLCGQADARHRFEIVMQVAEGHPVEVDSEWQYDDSLDDEDFTP